MRQRSGGTWELRAFAGRDPVGRVLTQVGAGLATESTFGELVERWFAVASVAKGLVTEDDPPDPPDHRHRLGPLWPLRLDKVRTWVIDNYYRPPGPRRPRRSPPGPGHGRDLCERGAPLSAATIRRTHVVAHAALEHAVAWEWIVVNPASKASLGRVNAPDIKPPTVDEVLALFRAAEKMDLDFTVFLPRPRGRNRCEGRPGPYRRRLPRRP